MAAALPWVYTLHGWEHHKGANMGEEVTGLVSFGNEKSSVVIVISGQTSPKCLELLKLLLKKWAKRCSLGITSVRVLKKTKKKKKKK